MTTKTLNQNGNENGTTNRIAKAKPKAARKPDASAKLAALVERLEAITGADQTLLDLADAIAGNRRALLPLMLARLDKAISVLESGEKR